MSPGPRRSHPHARPVFLLGEEETSPAPTFSREEAAPPAAPAAAAAAPHAQRQQERHPAQPPRQHPRRRRRPAAAAACCPRRLRLRCPPGRAASPCPLGARRRRRARPRCPPAAAPLARRQQPRSLARTPSCSGAHPGTARDVTEGGRRLLHIHEARTPAPASALPAPRPRPSTFLRPPLAPGRSCSSRTRLPEDPGGRPRGALRPRAPAPALQITATGDGGLPRKVVSQDLSVVYWGAGDPALPRPWS